jgi:hypothetical protein
MLTPCSSQPQSTFVPFGQTPAVNLLRHTAVPTPSCTKILNLGRDDIRNILFTLFSEPPKAGNVILFTVCGSDPAVLARNIFLLTYLVTHVSKTANIPDKLEPEKITKETATLWALYYHMYIIRDDMHVMGEHLKDILAASTTLAIWESSRYADPLKFLSESTLVEVRTYWQRYLDACNDPKSATRPKAAILKKFSRDETRSERLNLPANRTAGIHSLTHIPSLRTAFHKFWKTGVVAGNESDVAALNQEGDGLVNPLLSINSLPTRAFILHPNSDPLLSFHLAPVFDQPAKEKFMPEALAALAKAQFGNWCAVVQQHMRLRTVQISFHHGDSLSLCYWLQQHKDVPTQMPAYVYTYLRSWTAKTFDSTPTADLIVEYDVIETSELGDRCGVLNLLPAAIPLLSKRANAVLYTDTFRYTPNTTSEYLSKLLLAGPVTCALLFDLMPLGLATGTSVEHFGSDIIINHLSSDNVMNPLHRVRVTWKRPDGGDGTRPTPITPSPPQMSVDAKQLASFFINWYLALFRQSAQPARRNFHGTSEYRYTQVTFVGLIVLAHQQIETEWQKCITTLIDGIRAWAGHPQKKAFVQELLTLLHMSGLYCDPDLTKPASDTAKKLTGSSNQIALTSLKRFPELSNIVCVALVIPRRKFRVLPSFELEPFSYLGLHMVIQNEGMLNNRFASIHACFGCLNLGEGSAPASIEEDPAGWQGSSNLIVMCVVPAFQFLVGREGRTRVAVGVSDLSTTNALARVVGPGTRIFEASINDGNHVHLLTTLPSVASSPTSALCANVAPARNLHESASRLTMVNGIAKSLSARVTLTGKVECHQLKNDCVIRASQHGSCSMFIFIGPECRKLSFPFPIDGSRCDPKSSRAALWIELTAPITCAPKEHGYELDPFPLVIDRGQLLSWSLGRINLSICPPISSAVPFRHLKFFIEMAESIQEIRALANPANKNGCDDASEFVGAMSIPKSSAELSTSQVTMFKLKRSIALLFDAANDRVGRAGQTLNAVTMSTIKGEEFLIILGQLLHDLDQGSICMEAYVVPLPKQRPNQLTFALSSLKFTGRAVGIQIPEEVANHWKALLPAMVERCRYGWQHKSSCEYSIGEEFRCPRTRPLRKSPICSCGQGHDVDGIPEAYQLLGPFSTRVAISPLSAMPYVEVMALDMEQYELAKVWKNQLSQPVNNEMVQTRYLTSCSHCRKPGIDMIDCRQCHKEQWCSKKCEREARQNHKQICNKYTHFQGEGPAPKDVYPNTPGTSFQEHYVQFMMCCQLADMMNMSLEDYLTKFPPRR